MRLLSLSVALLLSALSAQAAVSIVSGNVYDVGKGSYSSDSSVGNQADKEYCWAATAANVFQHWQDRYLTETTGIPNGIAGGYSNPGGTQYLEIYQTFLDTFKDDAGLFSYAVDWYFNGKSVKNMKTDAGKGGYLPGRVSSTYYVYWEEKQSVTFTNMGELKDSLDAAFSQEGIGVYLGIMLPGNRKIGHAITCWGYETDADGNLAALYVTDSDDRHYGARRVDLHVEADGKISLSSPFQYGSYSSGTYTINEVSMLTPQTGTTFAAKTANPTLDALPADGGITGARDISGKHLSSASGITTLPESMLVSSVGEGASLTLGGAQRAQGVGFTAKAGSMVSLNGADVRVSNFEDGGISVGCEMYLLGGSLHVTGNGGTGISVQGTAENPKAFLRMDDNRSISMTGNDGGALYVGKSDSIAVLVQHNGAVTFSGNGATAQGAVVYNGGSLTFADNSSVTFSGNTAKYDIYNEGGLNLTADEGQTITFQHGVKNSSTGTTTLGAGDAGKAGTGGTYVFTDGQVKLTMADAHGTVGAGGGIVLADGCFTISEAAVTCALTVDLGNYLAENTLTMTNVALGTGSSLSLVLGLDAEAAQTFSLARAGSLTETVVTLSDYLVLDGTALTGADLSLTVAGRLADGTALVIDTAGLIAGNAVSVTGYDLDRTADGKLYYTSKAASAQKTPESATTTLSLLALATLAARRRRR